MRTVGVVAAAAWVPTFVVRAGSAATCIAPSGFPAGIELYRQGYENWSGEIRVDDVWTCAPHTPLDVVTIANWAVARGYRVRPRGMMHAWSPLTLTPDVSCDERVLLVDTTLYLTSMRMASGSPPAVEVQAGATLTSLLQFLEDEGLGFTAAPTIGEITVGGALAVNAHGAAIPAAGESHAGRSYGSLSNRVLALTAVVWDTEANAYVLRRFDRSRHEADALLTHLGRSFVTDVTLLAGPNDHLRCVSHVDIPASELFAAPGSAGRTVQRILEETGRVDAIWYAYTEKPWLKVWSIEPRKPSTSREVTEPYNYPFSDNIPDVVGELAHRIVTGEEYLAPVFGRAIYAATLAGLRACAASDLWGASKDVMLYIKASTLRVTQSGLAVLTRRGSVQRVAHEFVTRYRAMVDSYRRRDEYPINLGVEIRVTGLDDPRAVPVADARPPALSVLSPRPDHPEWDVMVWINTSTLPGTSKAGKFIAELETWAKGNYTGSYAAVRPEWSKGWAYTGEGAWRDTGALARTFPDAFGEGQGWESAVATLNKLDPHRTFSNRFLDVLFS